MPSPKENANHLHAIARLVAFFDQRLAKGAKPQIEDYLKECPWSARSDLLESLLRIEIQFLSGHGGCPPLSHYSARFKEYASVVARVYQEAASGQLSTVDPTPATEPAGLNVEAPTPGNRIGDYLLLNRVGRGGMGDVYRAYRVTLEMEVALKFLRHDRLQRFSPERQRQLLDDFKKEMQKTAGLHHEHIVTIFDTGVSNGMPFYAMNYLEQNLAKVVHRGPLPGRQAAEHMEKIARAVDYAFCQKQIVHRDIKPHNILLDGDKPILTDLGLATAIGELAADQIAGTPPYMAPEQARGEAVDRRTDVYGLGATLYHLISGRPPHQGSDQAETLEQVKTAEVVPPRRLNRAVPQDLEDITLKCLEKDVHRRYATAAALADDLRRYLSDQPVLAKRPPAWRRLQKWAQREPVRAALAGATALLLALLIFGGYSYNRRLSAALANTQQEKKRAEKHAAEAETERKMVIDIGNMLAVRVLSRLKQPEDLGNAIADLEKQSDSCRQLLKTRKLESLKLELADTLRDLTNRYLQKDQSKEASAALLECIGLQDELSRKTPILKVEVALNCMDLGAIYGRLGERHEELKMDQRALAILQQLLKDGYQASALVLAATAQANGLVGIDLAQKDDLESALKHQKEAVAILEQLVQQRDGQENITLYSFNKQLGIAYERLGKSLAHPDPRSALTYLQKSRDLFKGKTQYRRNMADVKLAMGSCYLQLNQASEAVPPLQEAHALIDELLSELPAKSRERNGHLQVKAEILSNEATAAQKKGDARTAEELLKQSLVIREAIAAAGAESLLVDGLSDLASFYVDENKMEQGLNYQTQAINLQETLVAQAPTDYTRRRNAGVLWYNKGIWLSNRQEFAAALDCYVEAKRHETEAFKGTGGGFSRNLDLTFQMLFKTQKRLAQYEAAVKTTEERVSCWPKDPQKHWEAALDLAQITDKQALPQVLAFFNRGLDKGLLRSVSIRNDSAFRTLLSFPEFSKLVDDFQNK